MKRTSQTHRLLFEPLESRRLLTAYAVDLGGVDTSARLAINASGQVAGSSYRADGTEQAFLWQNGVRTDLGTLGGPANYSRAFAINDAGQVVGYSASSTSVVAAFLLTPEDTSGDGAPDRWFRDSDSDGKNDLMRDLGTIGGNYHDAIARDVNNLGQVIGTITTVWPTPYSARSFLWQDGVMTDRGAVAVNAINDAGQVTEGNDINNAGQWVGSYAGVARVWTPTVPNGSTGTFATLGQLPPLWPEDYGYGTSVTTGAAAINRSGQIIGTQVDEFYGETQNGIALRAIRWVDGVAEALPLETADGINDAGQIVGTRAGHAFLFADDEFDLPALALGDATVVEGNSGTAAATFTVSLSRASAVAVTVEYATADGSAAAGTDYDALRGTLTFAPGETTKTISVAVRGDLLDESDERFSVGLTAATNARVPDGHGAGTVIDDDPPPSIGVRDFRHREGRGGRSLMYFEVSLSTASGKQVSVEFGTADGTARVGDRDYAARSGTVVFAPGETRKFITVVVFGDRKQEADETLFLNLRGAVNATLGDAVGVGTILNDDR